MAQEAHLKRMAKQNRGSFMSRLSRGRSSVKGETPERTSSMLGSNSRRKSGRPSYMDMVDGASPTRSAYEASSDGSGSAPTSPKSPKSPLGGGRGAASRSPFEFTAAQKKSSLKKAASGGEITEAPATADQI